MYVHMYIYTCLGSGQPIGVFTSEWLLSTCAATFVKYYTVNSDEGIMQLGIRNWAFGCADWRY